MSASANGGAPRWFWAFRGVSTCCLCALVTSSKSGIVNVYGSNASSSWNNSDRPKPLKSIGNLTTSISTVRFNHDSQLLAIASKTKKDQMRLVWLILCRSNTRTLTT